MACIVGHREGRPSYRSGVIDLDLHINGPAGNARGTLYTQRDRRVCASRQAADQHCRNDEMEPPNRLHLRSHQKKRLKPVAEFEAVPFLTPIGGRRSIRSPRDAAHVQAGLLTSPLSRQPSHPEQTNSGDTCQESSLFLKDSGIRQGHSGGPVPDSHGVPY